MSSVEHFARIRATASREAFLDRLGGGAVLVRLDERGGRGEPAPWAFQENAPERSYRAPPRDDEQVDAEALRKSLVQEPRGVRLSLGGITAGSADEPTATTALPPPPVPAARGAASVTVLPAALGSERALTLGRGPDLDIVLAERSVSRIHAELRADKGGFVLTDRGSSQGTRVNGRPLEPGLARALVNDDIIELGDVRCVYLEAERFWQRLPELMD